MNVDIRLLVSFKNHRKRTKLRRLIGDRSDSYLIDLWLTTAMDRPDGVLTGWGPGDIADSCNFDGEPQLLTDAFIDSGWLEINENDVFIVRNWEEHQKWACHAKQRSAAASKAAKARWDKKLNVVPEKKIKIVKNMRTHSVGNAAASVPHSDGNADALPPQSDSNADALPPQSDSNAAAMRKSNFRNAPSPSPIPSPFPSPHTTDSVTESAAREVPQEQEQEQKKEQGQERKTLKSRSGIILMGPIKKLFLKLWEKFPVKKERADCIEEFNNLFLSDEWNDTDFFQILLAGVDNFNKTNSTYTPSRQMNPLKFFRSRMWENETQEEKPAAVGEVRIVTMQTNIRSEFIKESAECRKITPGCQGLGGKNGVTRNYKNENCKCGHCEVIEDLGLNTGFEVEEIIF